MVRSHLDWRRASGLLPSAVKSAGHMDGTVRWWASLTGLDGRQSAVLGGAGADTDASGALSREDLAFFAVRGEYGDWQGRLHGKAERSAKERCRDAAKGASGGWCSLIFEAALLRLSSATCPFRHSHSLRPSPGPDAHTDPTISAIAAAIVLFAAAATPALFAAAVRVKPDTHAHPRNHGLTHLGLLSATYFFFFPSALIIAPHLSILISPRFSPISFL